MNPIALLFLALAMSTDAFAAAIGKGATLFKPRFIQALRIGLVFGVIEATTPLLGWWLGKSAAVYVNNWGHWVAFVVLIALGLHLIWEGIKPAEARPEKQVNIPLFKVVLTAVSTSIDAFAIGVGLAFVEVNIWFAAALIGAMTTVMVTIGILLGRVVASVLGQRAEIFGGVTLMGVATWLLVSH